MAADVVLAVVETDLRLLAAEAKKAEGPMTNLMGMLHHSELPAVKEATERALQKIRSVEHGGITGVQQALEILAPFSLACETKYAKLACIAISSFQKLLANDAVSIRGRCDIIKALQAAERLSDESVKLRILQASLTIIQSPSFADEQDAIQQLLSLAFRLYLNNRTNFAVHSTAAATIRQAVALIFDHSLLPSPAPPPRTPTGGSPAAEGTPPAPGASAPLRSGLSAGGTSSPGPPQAGGTGSAAAGNSAAAVTIAGAGADGGTPPGREVVPVLLLEEIMGWLGARDGKELGWVQLQQRGNNKIDRTFLLEMLEAVLLQRAVAIHRLPGLVLCVKTKVAPALNGLLDSACDRLVDPNDAGDCRLVVRCAAALVRRHHDLAPERAAAIVVRLAETAGSVGRPGAAHRWQRFMALQVLRPLLADPPLLYRLYFLSLPADSKQPGPAEKIAPAAGTAAALAKSTVGEAAGVAATAAATAASSGDAVGGGGVLPVVVQSLHDALRWYVRTSIETPEDDVVAALGNLYLQRAMGARDSVQETEAFGTNLATGSEVVIAHLALEGVLAMVAATEALTDVVVVPGEPGMPSPKLISRDTPEVRCVAVAGLVLELWRCALGVCNTLLARASHEVLVGLLVRGLQGITYSAGALGVKDARDALLHALCAHTLLPPGEDDAAALATGTAAAGGGGSAITLSAEDRSTGGSSRRLAVAPAAASGGAAPAAAAGFTPSPPPAPGFLTAILVERSAASVRVVLTPRNIAALRSLFNLAHRLADGLGSSGWLYVVDAVNALDRILASPHTTTAAYLLETGNEGEMMAGLQTMSSNLGPASGPGAGGSAAGIGGGGAAAAAVAAAAAAAAAGDGGADDGSTTAQRELRILASAADQLFENTHHMSPKAVVSLLSALSDISHRTLSGMGLLAGGGAAGAAAAATGTAASAAAPLQPSSGSGGAAAAAAATAGGAAAAAAGGGGSLVPSTAAASAGAPGAVRLCALNRMVDTLLHNLWRVQDLWGIFLAHVLEVLASNNVQVRAAAVDALDRTITGALNPDLHVPDKFTAPLPALEDALSPSAARKTLLPSFPSFSLTAPGGGAGGGGAVSPLAGSSTPIVVGGGGGGSRRVSREIGFTSPVSSPPVVLQPGPGRRVSGSGGGVSSSYPVSPLLISMTASPLPPPARRVSGSSAAAFARVSDSSSSHHLHPPLPPQPASAIISPSAAATVVTASSPFGAATAAAAAAAATIIPPLVSNRGVQQSAQREDVQHMLLVALDSLYREGGRTPDVRHGLLRISLHVLQHHGDGLTRGWVPLLRLLDAVPQPRAGQGPADVRLGFQVVELLATDYLSSSLPKEHVAKALDVIAKFATQDAVLNVSLSAITMLWNVTDHLARSRGTFSKAAGASQHPRHSQHQQQQLTATAAATAATPTATAATVGTPTPPPPAARPSPSLVEPSLGPYGVSGTSPFASSMYGSSDTTAVGEKPMSPAFAAALSFARGVPSLPAAASPERSPWAQLHQQQAKSEPAQQSQQQQQQQTPVVAGVAAAAAAATPAAGGSGSSVYPLHDLDEAESISMLMIAFRSLQSLSVDQRPEARNAAVRTLFLAVGSHGGKFPPATWHELFWSLLFDLLRTIHRVSSTSSVAEAAAVELGKEKGGRAVVMLVHHSRNSEQKQWDETLVLALGGAAKVMRSYLEVLSELDVWGQAWEELMQVLGELLASGRKGVILASTSLLTTVLQAHGSGPRVSRTMWQQTLAALDRGVTTMASPTTTAPLQARAELLTCITTLSSQLHILRCPARPGSGGAAVANGDVATTTTTTSTASTSTATSASSPDPEQLLLVLRWLDRFARYPVGADDTSSIHFTTIGPIQKAVLAALAALPPAAAAAGVWPAVLSVLCNMLRPFSTLALRQYAQQAAALQQQRKASASSAAWSASLALEQQQQPPSSGIIPPAASTATVDPMTSYTSAGTAASSSREPSVHGPGSPPWLTFVASGEVMEARAMSPLWMARVVELLAAWYRDHVSWQVRVATFPLLVGAMSECMACRHLLPYPGPAASASAAAPPGPASQSLPPQLLLMAGDSGEAAALEELWRGAARGFVTVVQSGLPSINICSLQSQQQAAAATAMAVPHSTWPALSRAFQMFFLAASLPPLQVPPPEAQHTLSLALMAAGGSGATAAYFRRMSSSTETPAAAASSAAAAAQPSLEQVAADLEITTTVLDCLTETVLNSCQHAPIEMRRTLVEVMDAGAASAAAPAAAGISAAADKPYDESGLPPTSRLSHVCLNKLYVLCSRGQEAPAHEPDGQQQQQPQQQQPQQQQQPSARSQLEVAQLALPVFVSRCETILLEYARAEQRGRSGSSSNAPATASDTAAGAAASSAATNGDGLALTAYRSAAPSAPVATSAALHDKARHVLELLQQLRVVPPVSDSLLPSRPHLRFWLEVARAVRSHAAMPLAAGAATAAAAAAPTALHSVPSLGGGGGSMVLQSPPAVSRRSSSGFDMLSPMGGAGAGGAEAGPGSAAGEPSFSNGGPVGRSSSSSFFSRTYSSTGALLSSALGVGGGSGAAFAATLTSPSKRPSGSGGGGGGVAAAGSGGSQQQPLHRGAAAAGGSSGPGSVSSFGHGHGLTIVTSTGAAGLSLPPMSKSMWVKEQPHLPALYGVLCECIGSSDPAVRSAVQGMLVALGGGVGLCAPPVVPPPPYM